MYTKCFQLLHIIYTQICVFGVRIGDNPLPYCERSSAESKFKKMHLAHTTRNGNKILILRCAALKKN